MTVIEDLSVEKTVDVIIDHILEKKGEAIVVMDLRGVTGVTDFFVIATGTSNVQVRAIADEVKEKLKKDHGINPWHAEGYQAQKWILLDYVNIVVHVFDAETRSYYDIEKLWGDAKIRVVDTNY